MVRSVITEYLLMNTHRVLNLHQLPLIHNQDKTKKKFSDTACESFLNKTRYKIHASLFELEMLEIFRKAFFEKLLLEVDFFFQVL